MVARNAFAALAQEHANNLGTAHLMSGSKIKWRREFNLPNATYWDITTPTPGIVIPDPVGGTISVNMGTTVGAESAMTSKQIFSFPLKVAVGLQLSQKIANNEVYVELVGCDALGNVDETRVAAWRIAGNDSTTNTIARSEVNNGAAARRQSANLTTVAQTGAVAIMEITAESDEIWFSSKPGDSTNARTVATVMNIVAPDPEGFYKVRIRFKNGTVAPASATTVTLQFALAIDYTEQQVEVTGGNGNSQPGQSIPVSVIGQPAVTAHLSGNGTSVISSTTNLAAGAAFSGTSIDNGTNIASQAIRAVVAHTAGLTPGMLVFEESIDAATWVETSRIPIPSDGLQRSFEFPISGRAGRVRFVNGATAQTAFRFNSYAVRVSSPTFASLNKLLNFPLSITALAAAATFTGPTLDLGAQHSWETFRAFCFADQAGTMIVQQSRDNVNWRNVRPVDAGLGAVLGGGGVTVAANVAEYADMKIIERYVRVIFVNGATAQTVFNLDATLVSL